MGPPILIIEPRREVAIALEAVVNSARYTAVVLPHLEQLSDLGVRPAAIIVRVAFESPSEPAHASIARLGRQRPPVIAIVWKAEEAAEAHRLHCEAVLRAPQEVSRLCEVLEQLVRS